MDPGLAAVSGSAIFLTGEARMGFAEEAVLVSTTMLVRKEEKYMYEDLSLRQLRERETKLETT